MIRAARGQRALLGHRLGARPVAVAAKLQRLDVEVQPACSDQLGRPLREPTVPTRTVSALSAPLVLLAGGVVRLARRAVRRDFDRACALLLDQTEQQGAGQQADHRGERRFRALVQHSADVIVVADAGGVITYHSPSLSALLPGEPDLVGRSLYDLAAPAGGTPLRTAFDQCVADSGHRPVVEVELHSPGGPDHILQMTLTNLLREPAVVGVVVNAVDITERVRHEQELARLAFHDRVTGLPNRLLLEQELVRRFATGRPNCLLMLDIDGYKLLNNGLGEAVGEALLVEIGHRLAAMGTGMVAHLGGDRFAVLLAGPGGFALGARPALALAEALAVEFGIGIEVGIEVGVGPRSVPVQVSLGVAASRTGLPDASELLRRAEAAMVEAKVGGGGRAVLFDDVRHELRAARSRRVRLLAGAADRGELELHHQPLVSLDTGAVTGVEALLRWRRDGALIPPDEFIPLAEDSGLILGLGAWVIDRACRDLVDWAGWAREGFSVAVNVSARQLLQPDFVAGVAATLERCGLSPGRLVVELTETTVMENPDAAIATLAALRRLGLRIAIDDFGTGFSSLGYLMRLPVDIVKIDRSLLADIAVDGRAEALLRGLVGVAHDLGLSVTVEGVELVEELLLVTEAGADTVQGFLLATPVPAEQLLGSVTRAQLGPVRPRLPAPRSGGLASGPASAARHQFPEQRPPQGGRDQAAPQAQLGEGVEGGR